MTDKEKKHHTGLAHIVPFRTLAIVFAILVVLTVLTVAAVYVDLGNFNLYLAMTIATVKAMLVALYFMHLRYDRPFHGLVFFAALMFVLLFVGIVLTDTQHYQPDIRDYQEEMLDG